MHTRSHLAALLLLTACDYEHPEKQRAIAKDTTKYAAEWNVTKDSNAVDGTIDASLLLGSLPPSRLVLTVSCGKRFTAILIPRVLPDEDFTKLRYRFDEDSVTEARWVTAHTTGVIINLDARKLLKQMASSRKWAVEVTATDESGTFDVSGFKAQAASIAGPCAELAR